MAYYQCFKTKNRTIYCSTGTFNSHPEARGWIAACLAAHDLRGNDIHQKPWEQDSVDETDEEIIRWP